MKTENNDLSVLFKTDMLYQVSLLGFSSDSRAASERISEIRNLVVSFEVTSQPNGQFERPHLYGIFELNDRYEAVDLTTINGVKFSESTFLKVSEERQMVFLSEKRYEFFAAWLKAGKEHLLQEFFVASEPIKQRYGRPTPDFKIQFEPVPKVTGASSYVPSLAGLVEWDDDSDVAELLKHPEFAAKAAPLFGEAIERMEMVLGQVI